MISSVLRPYVAVLAIISLPGIIVAGESDGSQKIPWLDRVGPDIEVTPFRAPSTDDGSLSLHIAATDPGGISSVEVYQEGNQISGRVRQPYLVDVWIDVFPVEFCAMARDTFGNSSLSCVVVEGPPEFGCFDSEPCESHEYCKKAFGECDTVGECAPVPSWVPLDCPGVCGCDGKGYCNISHAAVWGRTSAFPGCSNY
jgi:hypothetical protein